jgi:hypothetical protein
LHTALAIGQMDSSQVLGPSVSSAGSLGREGLAGQQQVPVEEVGPMDEHIIEIDQIEDGRLVLIVPSLRLIVIGRTLEEARAWASSAIACRGLSASQRAEPSAGTDEVSRSPSSQAA